MDPFHSYLTLPSMFLQPMLSVIARPVGMVIYALYEDLVSWVQYTENFRYSRAGTCLHELKKRPSLKRQQNIRISYIASATSLIYCSMFGCRQRKNQKTQRRTLDRHRLTKTFRFERHADGKKQRTLPESSHLLSYLFVFERIMFHLNIFHFHHRNHRQ